jgi:hypothetical protein
MYSGMSAAAAAAAAKAFIKPPGDCKVVKLMIMDIL